MKTPRKLFRKKRGDFPYILANDVDARFNKIGFPIGNCLQVTCFERNKPYTSPLFYGKEIKCFIVCSPERRTDAGTNAKKPRHRFVSFPKPDSSETCIKSEARQLSQHDFSLWHTRDRKFVFNLSCLPA